jgi:hypothetical protein
LGRNRSYDNERLLGGHRTAAVGVQGKEPQPRAKLIAAWINPPSRQPTEQASLQNWTACLQVCKAWTVGTVFALPIHSVDPAN